MTTLGTSWRLPLRMIFRSKLQSIVPSAETWGLVRPLEAIRAVCRGRAHATLLLLHVTSRVPWRRFYASMMASRMLRDIPIILPATRDGLNHMQAPPPSHPSRGAARKSHNPKVRLRHMEFFKVIRPGVRDGFLLPSFKSRHFVIGA